MNVTINAKHVNERFNRTIIAPIECDLVNLMQQIMLLLLNLELLQLSWVSLHSNFVSLYINVF